MNKSRRIARLHLAHDYVTRKTGSAQKATIAMLQMRNAGKRPVRMVATTNKEN